MADPEPEAPDDLSEGRARSLALFAGALLAALASTAAARYAYLRGWLPFPEIPWNLGPVALWALCAFGILFGLERGDPRDTPAWRRVRVLRKLVLLASLGALAEFIYL